MPRSITIKRTALVSLHLTREELEGVDGLVYAGLFPSRSEVIRSAIILLLQKIKPLQGSQQGNQQVSQQVGLQPGSEKSNGKTNGKAIARLVCSNGHVVAFLKKNGGFYTLGDRVKALAAAGLMCPVCGSTDFVVEFVSDEVTD